MPDVKVLPSIGGSRIVATGPWRGTMERTSAGHEQVSPAVTKLRRRCHRTGRRRTPSSSTIAARAIPIGERRGCGSGCDVAAHQTRDRLGVAIPRSWNNGVGMGPPAAPQTLRSASGTSLASELRTIGAFSGKMVDVRPGSSATFESSYLYQSELTKGSKASVTRTPKTTRRNFSGNGEKYVEENSRR